jgi:hypothetical protein
LFLLLLAFPFLLHNKRKKEELIYRISRLKRNHNPRTTSSSSYKLTIMSEAVTKAMEDLTLAPPAPKGTAKRDALRANEVAVQRKWAEAKAFEADPRPGEESFMVTFPYPYSNGHLHIGHAFSLTKAVFRAQYERHQGKNVLFPFAFHCTGMPIQAVSTNGG